VTAGSVCYVSYRLADEVSMTITGNKMYNYRPYALQASCLWIGAPVHATVSGNYLYAPYNRAIQVRGKTAGSNTVDILSNKVVSSTDMIYCDTTNLSLTVRDNEFIRIGDEKELQALMPIYDTGIQKDITGNTITAVTSYTPE